MNDSSKINVVLLTDCLADLAGGAEKQIYELARGLDKDKYNVFVVSLDCWGQASGELIESTGSQLHIFRVVRIYGISGLVQGMRFWRFLRQNNINVILTYHFSSDMWGTFWGHLAGVPAIMSNRRDMGFWRNNWHVLSYKLINPWVNKIIVVSKSIKQMVMDTEGVSPEHIEVIYNGVHLPPSEENDDNGYADLGLKKEDSVIMHVANLKPVKGHKYLIEAFASVVGHHPEAKLVLIGKDELNGQLQNMALSLGIQNNVLFPGKRDNVSRFLGLADICVLPSLSEGMSNAILEYMACAKPVIATRVGGNPELVKEQFNGLLVEKENTDQLKKALLELLDDRSKRLTMGENGLLRVKAEFSMEGMLAHYDRLLLQTARIKILHLVSSGGLFGAERVILNLASQNSRVVSWVGALFNQYNPHLEIIQEAKNLGLSYVVFDSHTQADFHTVTSIKKFLKENSIDILHTHNYKSDIVGFLATRLTQTKWVGTNHVWHGTDKKLRFYESLDAVVLKFASMVFTVSQEIKDGLLKKGFKESKLHVVHNGIAINHFGNTSNRGSLRNNWNVAPDDVLLAIVGRLAPEKAHEVLFKALKKALVNDSHIKCLVVGDGPLKDQLEAMAHELGVSSHIIFTGIRKDMPDVYAAADILVNASFIEGLPMTILEAMASKLAVIATNVGAVPQVIKNQDNGVILEPGDMEALAAAISDLAKDKEKRQRLAVKAYEDVCLNFSDKRMAQEYEGFYQRLVVN